MKKIFTLIMGTALFAGLLTAGCGETDCPLTTTSLAHFDFLDSNTHQPVTFTDSVAVTGIIETPDSLDIIPLYNMPQSSMSLPLGHTNQTTYVIHYTKLMRDTIVLTHENIPFISKIECGTMLFYNVEKVTYTTNALDSVVLVNANITNEEKKNFNISTILFTTWIILRLATIRNSKIM